MVLDRVRNINDAERLTWKGEKIVTLRSMRERNQQDQVDPKLFQENDFHICLSVTSEDLK